MAPNVTYVLTLSVKEKKNKTLPCVIYIFPSSASLFLYWGKLPPSCKLWGPKATALMRISSESQLLASQVTHVGQT